MDTYPRSTWRVLRTPPASGAWNMALDEAILEAAAARRVLPTLRLYAWEPPCLSLGYAQPYSDIDLSALANHAWQVVRRPTGGRAILHTDELTYSVTGPEDEPRLSGGVLESYRRLAQALLMALHRLAIPAEAHAETPLPPGLDPQGAVCFEVPSNYEITVGGKKLIGSAQARRKAGVLQHGSLPLKGDLGRITQVLKFESPAHRAAAAHRLLERATTAEAILGSPPSWEQACTAFQQAFGEALNLDLRPAEPEPAELDRAQELLEDKYAAPAWTEKA